ncbi:MAG TPA: hypothetical protein VIK35_01830 [Verrucomicrobiae bacterium]
MKKYAAAGFEKIVVPKGRGNCLGFHDFDARASRPQCAGASG